jgi:hypothetical protein
LSLEIGSCLEEKSDHLKTAYFGGYLNCGLAQYTWRCVDFCSSFNLDSDDLDVAYDNCILK